jgi:hypothetical protein
MSFALAQGDPRWRAPVQMGAAGRKLRWQPAPFVLIHARNPSQKHYGWLVSFFEPNSSVLTGLLSPACVATRSFRSCSTLVACGEGVGVDCRWVAVCARAGSRRVVLGMDGCWRIVRAGMVLRWGTGSEQDMRGRAWGCAWGAGWDG